MMTEKGYHYLECGLDNVYLADGFEFHEGARGRTLKIKDLDNLHQVIGRALVTSKDSLNGKEVRFLRTEMGMSQNLLAKLLQVSEQSVARWEKGKSELPKPAENLIRLLYGEHIKEPSPHLKQLLEKLANLEHAVDMQRVTLHHHSRRPRPWTVEAKMAA